MAENNNAKWYVVHTYSGYENKVMTDLEKVVENRGMQDLIFDIKVPTETVEEVGADGKVKQSERKIFPGYVFIKMIVTDDSWYVVRNTRGCTGFVGPSSKPVPLTQQEVENAGVEKRSTDVENTAEIETTNEVASSRVEVKYSVGDEVKIIDGPLEGYKGIVDQLDVENNYVQITISMFGRETPVELLLNQITLAD